MPLVLDCIIQMKQTTLLIRYWSFLLPKQDTRSPEMAFWSHNPATSPDHETASLFSVLEQLKRLCRRSEKTHRQALFCQLIDQKRHNQSERLCRRSEKTHRQALFCQLVDQKRHNQSTMRRRLLACEGLGCHIDTSVVYVAELLKNGAAGDAAINQAYENLIVSLPPQTGDAVTVRYIITTAGCC